VLTELGEYDAAFAGESLYGRLSVLMGNHAGLAEAPLVLASVELARGRLGEADKLIASARKVAESNGWDMLVAWSRALSGRLRLQRYKQATDALELSRAKADFLAAIETYEERSLAWTEELDPAEVYAHYALTLKWTGQVKQARDTLTRAAARFPKDNAISHEQLKLAQRALDGDTTQEWFESRGFVRRVALWRALNG
jgi:tetratricopeptide (TPR) repeat protein